MCQCIANFCISTYSKISINNHTHQYIMCTSTYIYCWKKNQYIVIRFKLFNTNFFKKYFPHFILKSLY